MRKISKFDIVIICGTINKNIIDFSLKFRLPLSNLEERLKYEEQMRN